MFSFVNYLAVPMIPNYAGESPHLGLIQTVSMGSAAVLGGFLVDSLGRKRMAIAGFAMLGLGSAVIGFLGYIPLGLYFNSVIDGVAWGLLLGLFVLTLWGDLSHGSSSDKYYALGVMPFFASKLLELTVRPYILPSLTSTTAFFSFTAFFLFLAVLPLVYAPETLPEKIMKDRGLRSYVDKAIKKVQSEKERGQKTSREELQKEDLEIQVKPGESEEENEEAEQLAEKYY